MGVSVYIDIETFSKLNVRQVGAYRMAEHPSTEILMLCWAVDDGPIQRWTFEDAVLPDELIRLLSSDSVLVWAHNAEFERVLLHSRAGQRIGFPHVPLERWRDTQAIAAALALPLSLDKGAAAVGLGVSKDPRGTRLIHKFAKPRRPSKSDPSTRWGPHNARKDWEDFVDYCAQDTNVLRQYRHALEAIRPLPESEWEVWRFTLRMHENGLPIDVPLVKKAKKLFYDYIERLQKECEELTAGVVLDPEKAHEGGVRATQRDKILLWFQENGLAISEVTKGVVNSALLEEYGKIDDTVRRVLEIRLEVGKTSVKKINKMLQCVCADGRVRGTLQYHGASPGRFAGRLIQPQNFPRGHLKPEQIEEAIGYIEAEDLSGLESMGNPADIISSCLRAMIAAPEGKVIVAGDYSSIEARGVCWVAGQEDVLEEYRQGIDAYISMGATIFYKAMEDIQPEERKLGKDTVLGCGYQMGYETFRAQILAKGGDVDEALAKRCVDAYRKKHYKVRKLWASMQNKALLAIDNPDRWVSVNKYVKFLFHRDFLWMKLPSGRLLAYPYAEVRLTEKKFRNGDKKKVREITFMGIDFKGKWARLSTYGGKLTENAVQAIARDLMINGMFKVAAVGFEMITTVHDELVSLIDASKKDKAAFNMGSVMCVLPDWAEGFPLAAGAYAAKRYRKD